MRALSLKEIAAVAGGNNPGDIIVIGRRVMTDEQIEAVMEEYRASQGFSGGGSSGGGGDTGGGGTPPPATHVWEEDTDGDGRVDTLWIDNNGDGELGVGDGFVAFDNGPWTNLDAAERDAIAQGLSNWAQEYGWDFVVAVGTAAAGAAGVMGATGSSVLTVTIAAAQTAVSPQAIAIMLNALVVATVGNIDVSTANSLGAATYSNWFNTYNPYTNGGGVGGAGSGGGADQQQP